NPDDRERRCLPAAGCLSSALMRVCRFRLCDIGGKSVAEIQGGAAHGEGACGDSAGLGTLAHNAAIFKREAVRVLEVDRLRPLVVDDLGDGDTLGPQFVTLARQTGRRTGLKGEVIKAGRHPEPPRLMPAS